MAQAAALARGHKIDGDHLPEITAYLDQRMFGALPHEGGTLDQPAWLMDGMRLVAQEVSAEEERRAKAEQRKHGRGR